MSHKILEFDLTSEWKVVMMINLSDSEMCRAETSFALRIIRQSDIQSLSSNRSFISSKS